MGNCKEEYKKNVLMVLWNSVFNETTMDENLKDKLSWRKKDGYFAIQDFLYACAELSKELLEKYFAIDYIDKKYSNCGAYENVYEDVKKELHEKLIEGV